MVQSIIKQFSQIVQILPVKFSATCRGEEESILTKQAAFTDQRIVCHSSAQASMKVHGGNKVDQQFRKLAFGFISGTKTLLSAESPEDVFAESIARI